MLQLTTPLREHGLSISIPTLNEESVGIIFGSNADRIVNDWISGRQKLGATRMRTERLKKKLDVY